MSRMDACCLARHLWSLQLLKVAASFLSGVDFRYQKIATSAPAPEPILFGRLAGLSPLSFPAWSERDLPMDFSPRRECNEKKDSLA